MNIKFCQEVLYCFVDLFAINKILNLIIKPINLTKIMNQNKKLLSAKIAFVSSVAVIAVITIFFYIKKDKSSLPSQNKELTSLNSTGLDPKQEVKNVAQVEEVIVKWVQSNPAAIIESVVEMEKRNRTKQQEEYQKNVSLKTHQLFDDNTDPKYSSGKYDVSLVEFFDYNCGYCKKAQSSIEKIIKDDSKIRIIFKELPILGKSSEELSRVAIAVNMNNSKDYLKFHNALMKGSPRSKEEAIEIAKNLGIDTVKIEQILNKKKDEIENKINDNKKLSMEVGVNGTPAFIIGDDFIPGAIEYDSLKEKIAKQRKK